MGNRTLRARINRLEAELHRRVRMPELIAKFKNGDMTPQEENEALSLSPRWPAMKAAIRAEWERQVSMEARNRKRPKSGSVS